MKKLIFTAGAAILVLSASLAIYLTGERGRWLSLQRSDIIRLLAEDKSDAAIKIESLKEFQAALAVQQQNERQTGRLGSEAERRLEMEQTNRREKELARLSDALSAGETVWVATNPTIPLTVVMAGKGDRIHTLRITLPVVNLNATQSDRVLKVLSELFRLMFPEWSEAKDWPIQSLKDAWGTFKRQDLRTRNDRIIRKVSGGVTSATFGVPPDIVVYTITARAHCVPDAEKDNVFQRVIC